ncbi:MAG: protein-export chaperone SecB [SAR86 cluster bacterium]|uniref:Protein-export protein SecB n=1 Tax=SAR86 cluster bacterium TaxID=2030880 RepID=A0A2A5CIM7_9GAMM|nr:protein-export chaperone SecB [Gammaproteobacteria bacterium AH-315-E17]PCJ43729.1 MAG: protein-export chaperone SecB [SAR86 cluster bacterium]
MADTEDQVSEQAAGQENKSAPKFIIQRVYVKDSSFEAPNTPDVFKTEYKPNIQFNMNTKTNSFQENFHEVILTLTVEVKSSDDKVFFIVEVQQAGIFNIEGLDGDRLTEVLHITCPNVLYPYAREAVDNLATKGSFPPLMLAPVNFESAFVQAREQQAKQLKETAS